MRWSSWPTLGASPRRRGIVEIREAPLGPVGAILEWPKNTVSTRMALDCNKNREFRATQSRVWPPDEYAPDEYAHTRSGIPPSDLRRRDQRYTRGTDVEA